MAFRIQLPDDDTRLRSSILADPCQRRILVALLEHSRPMTDRDLAVRLAARDEDTSLSNVTEAAVEGRLVDLHHRKLPKLEAIGWIDRRPDGIVTTERIPFEGPEPSLPPFRDRQRQWEVLTALLARPYRQFIVVTLARTERPMTLDGLADELAVHDPSTVGGDDRASPRVLHHVDLPRLDETGLIEYVPDAHTIARDPDLAALADWIEVDDAETDAVQKPEV